jgi:hypothetical protein
MTLTSRYGSAALAALQVFDEIGLCLLDQLTVMGIWSQLSGTAGWAATKGKAAACSTGAAVSRVAAPALTKVKNNSRDIAVVTTGTVVANAAVVPALSCAGFTAVGPAAGSLAAGWMSLYGGAVSAGAF